MHRLHYDYGVIDHDCDREHECGKGKQVDGKSEYIHQEECTNQCYRDRDNRYKSRSEILKEYEHNKEHENESLDERFDNLMY